MAVTPFITFELVNIEGEAKRPHDICDGRCLTYITLSTVHHFCGGSKQKSIGSVTASRGRTIVDWLLAAGVSNGAIQSFGSCYGSINDSQGIGRLAEYDGLVGRSVVDFFAGRYSERTPSWVEDQRAGYVPPLHIFLVSSSCSLGIAKRDDAILFSLQCSLARGIWLLNCAKRPVVD